MTTYRSQFMRLALCLPFALLAGTRGYARIAGYIYCFFESIDSGRNVVCLGHTTRLDAEEDMEFSIDIRRDDRAGDYFVVRP